jgi:hypothetical protein
MRLLGISCLDGNHRVAVNTARVHGVNLARVNLKDNTTRGCCKVTSLSGF